MNYLYLKLALIMGLSWLVYVVCISVTEICNRSTMVVAQVFVFIGAVQVNVQGVCVVMCLFWGAAYEKFFAKKKRPKSLPQNNNNNNNINNFNMQQFNIQQQQQQINLEPILNRNYHQRISVF